MAFAALALAALAGPDRAQAQTYVASFDTDITANDGAEGDLGGSTTRTWDGAVNAPGGPAGGSLYLTVPFANSSGWQELQLHFSGDQNLANYINVEFDIKVDVANSHVGPNGYGAIYPVIQNWSGGSPGWGQLSPQFVTNNGTGWQHMSFQLIGVAGSMNRLVLDLNTGGGPVTNTCAYWIDNIALTTAALPPPTLASPVAAPAETGLTLLPATTGQYQRVMVYPNPTLGTSWGWYGVGGPVSYSFTITNFPNVNNYGAQMFLIPNATMQYTATDTSVDWNCTNDLVLSISANGDNPPTGWGVTFAAKTNSPGALGQGNPNLTITNFAYNTLPVGTWTVTFNNNTDFTITAPDNSVVSASLPADVADIVSGNAAGNTAMTAYFGIQPNNPAGLGKAAVFSNIKITGTTSPNINDNFNTGSLDTNTWSKLSDQPLDIFVNDGDLIYYVTWNTPNDQGYSTLLSAATVSGPWVDLVSSADWMLVNGNKAAKISKSALQSLTGQSGTAFFRLIKRQFSQLQVLLPGETSAPNTPTGKTGTPTPITTGDIINVTINSVDDNFNIVNASDMIHLVGSDPSVVADGDYALSGGTVSILVQFQSAGAFTVTASDLTDPTKTSGTSSSITVTDP